MDLIQLHRLSSGIPSQALAWAIDPSLKRNNETLLSICLSTACWRTRLINFGIGSITMVCRQDMLRVLLLNISNCCVQMVQDNCLFFKSTFQKLTVLSDQHWQWVHSNGLEMLAAGCVCGPIWEKYVSGWPAQCNDKIWSGDVDCWYWHLVMWANT